MAIVRPDLNVDEVRVLLEHLPTNPDRALEPWLFMAHKKLKRCLREGLALEDEERAKAKRLRAKRRVVDFEDEPIVTNRMLRRDAD